ncbi:MAG: hypothetical protein WC809_08255 [Sinimarinibacterium sp.]
MANSEVIASGVDRVSGPVGGWSLVFALWGVAVALAVSVLAGAGSEYSGTWLNLKLTARWSFLIFLAVYVARPAHQLWRTTFTKQLLARRRHLGIAFALAHYTHLTLIVYLFTLAAPGSMPMMSTGQPMALVVPIGGSLAYVLLTAMVVTSFNAPKDWMRRIHPKAWKTLHRVGIHYFMFIYTLDWIEGLAIKTPWWFYAPFLLASLAAIVVRAQAFRSTRRSAVDAQALSVLQLRG